MKKLFVSLLVVLLAAMLVTPALALQADVPVTEEQVIVIGIVATAVTFILRVLFTYAKVQLSRIWVNIMLLVISGVLAFTWAGLSFPPFPAEVGGYWQWLNDLFLLVMPILGTASFIYNLLYTKVIVPLSLKYEAK
jgi:hypothetical protein